MAEEKINPTSPVLLGVEGVEAENGELATTVVFRVQDEISGMLGVLLTQAEAVLGNDPRLKPFKDQIKREVSLVRNRIQDQIYFALGVQDRLYSPGNVYLTNKE